MFTKAIAAAIFAAVLGVAPASADVSVHLLNVEQNFDVLFKQIADDYNKSHPGVTVVVDYLEGEAFKAKLPTLLQSNTPPDIIYSWAGGVMRAQIDAGYLQDISAAIADVKDNFYPAALGAYNVDGKYYGVPFQLSDVGLFYNKKLLAKGGVDPSAIKTWDDFLQAVKKLKAAGITPIVMGGGEKWPMHFYWSYLVMRLGGSDVISNAEAGKDGGFKAEPFVQAGKLLKDLADLEPFQDGWLSTPFLPSTGMFGDGKGAFDLMGNWFLGIEGPNSSDGKGLAESDIGMIGFPTLPGGKGQATDQLGGIQGFLVTKAAPKEAVDFLKFFSSAAEQSKAAAGGVYIPAVKGTDGAITDPLIKQVAQTIAGSGWILNFLDQELGPSVGRVVNDASVGIAAGQMSSEDAAAAIEDAWQQR